MTRVASSILLVVLCAAPAAGQSPTPADSAQLMMRGALRMLATAQETYFAEHRTYTTDVAALGRMVGAATNGVQLAIWSASTEGWAMEARHPALPGQSCVMYRGTAASTPEVLTQEQRLPGSARAGRVRCDFDSGA
jgi:hypothetical protein